MKWFKLATLLAIAFPAFAGNLVIVGSGGIVETPAFKFGILTGEADDTFTLPLYDGGTYNFTVNWGDASSSTITSWDDADTVHTYADEGATAYNIEISGTINGWKFENAGDCQLMRDITQWGCFRPGNTGYAFQGCDFLTISATDRLNLSGVTTMDNFFQGCGDITTIPSANSWDVSSVAIFTACFHSCSTFNQDIGSWNVANATNIGYMFYGCALFNQSLNSWNTAKVTNMNWTFYDADDFNGNITSWDVSKVTTFETTFRGCSAFNQNIGSWTPLACTDMGGMFLSCTLFNQDISSWNVNGVLDMSHMFHDAVAFNQDIGAWDVSTVVTLNNMFEGAIAFEQALEEWEPESATDMTDMFDEVTLDVLTYDTLIKAWADVAVQNSVPFHGSEGKYSADAVEKRAHLTTAPATGHGWTITDGGLEE